MPDLDKNKSNALSIGRFKDMKSDDLTDSDFRDYILAKLMQTVMQRLEVAIVSDRMFARTRTDVMSAFWTAREEFENRVEPQDDTKGP
jgi:hypothetical protein